MPARNQRTPSRGFSASSFVAGLIVGGGVALISVYLLQVPQGPDPAPADADQVKTERSGDTDGAPRYEFFESLPEAEVVTDTEPYKAKTPGGYVRPTEYVVQVGSFRSEDDANRLRARLMLTGMNAEISVRTLDDEGGIWHRVLVGPFSSRTDAEQTVTSLQQQDLSPTMLTVPAAG